MSETNIDQQKEYYSIEEATHLLGMNRASLWERLKMVGIKPRHFPKSRLAFLSAGDIQLLLDIKEHPWKIEAYINQNEQDQEAPSATKVVVVVDVAAQDIAEKLSLIKGKPTKKQVYTIVREGLLRRDIAIKNVSASVAYVQQEQPEEK